MSHQRQRQRQRSFPVQLSGNESKLEIRRLFAKREDGGHAIRCVGGQVRNAGRTTMTVDQVRHHEFSVERHALGTGGNADA